MASMMPAAGLEALNAVQSRKPVDDALALLGRVRQPLALVDGNM
jgi:hypothetical protein